MGEGLTTLDCAGLTTREINAVLKDAARSGPGACVALLHPDSRHNLAVGLTTPLAVRIAGHVGYYCGGLCDGVDLTIGGDAGWGLAENLMGGRVLLSGSAGSSAGATLRGGLVAIGGSAGARCGIAMKGGTLVVGGDVGAFSAFMMQKGALIVGGDAGEALGDSLYEGKIYVLGRIESLGSDAVQADLTDADIALLSDALAAAGMDASPGDFKKVVSGKRLYNFNTREREIWQHAL